MNRRHRCLCPQKIRKKKEKRKNFCSGNKFTKKSLNLIWLPNSDKTAEVPCRKKVLENSISNLLRFMLLIQRPKKSLWKMVLQRKSHRLSVCHLVSTFFLILSSIRKKRTLMCLKKAALSYLSQNQTKTTSTFPGSSKWKTKSLKMYPWKKLKLWWTLRQKKETASTTWPNSKKFNLKSPKTSFIMKLCSQTHLRPEKLKLRIWTRLRRENTKKSNLHIFQGWIYNIWIWYWKTGSLGKQLYQILASTS